MKIYILFCLLAGLNIACSSGKKDHLYENDHIGWRMKVPDKWTIRAGEALNDYLNSANPSGYKILPQLVFQKDSNNYFISILQQYGDTVRKDWEHYIEQRDSALLTSYITKAHEANLGITYGSTSRVRKIGERWFLIFELNKYKPDKQIAETQILYSTLFNDTTFTAGIYSNNEIDKHTVTEAFENSGFSR